MQTSGGVMLVTQPGAPGSLLKALGVRKHPETGGYECGEKSPAIVKEFLNSQTQ